MITSSEQILQALAKYNFSYRMLTMEERFAMLNELQQVEWKLGRGFDPIEVAALDTYFGSDLERILSWLTDRMKLVSESVRPSGWSPRRLSFAFCPSSAVELLPFLFSTDLLCLSDL